MFPNPFRKAPDKKASGKAGSKPKSGSKASAGRGGSGGSGTRARSKGKGAGAQRPLPAPGLSLDRKLDITGIVLVFIGLLTGLSLFSANNSDIPFLTAWLSLNRQIAGWGVFGLPLGFIAVGLWLVLRKFGDRLPKVEGERLVGLVLLYLALLTTFHFMAADTKATVFDIVKTGRGGGLLGAAILWTLLGALGTLGAAVLLTAWWIIAVVLTAGLSVPELLMLGAGLVRRLRGQPVERQLPLPNMDTPALRGAPAAEPIAAPRPSQPSTARPPSAKASAPAAPPSAGPLVPAAEAERFPAPATAPAPSYDQPLVIGGDQPWVLPEVVDMLDPGTESGADDEYDRQRANMIEAHPGRLWRAGEGGGGQPRPHHHPVRRRARFCGGPQRQEDQGQSRQDRLAGRRPGAGALGPLGAHRSAGAGQGLRGHRSAQHGNLAGGPARRDGVGELRQAQGHLAAGAGPGRVRHAPSPPGSTACPTCSSPAPPAPARACASTPSSPACCCRTRPTT